MHPWPPCPPEALPLLETPSLPQAKLPCLPPKDQGGSNSARTQAPGRTVPHIYHTGAPFPGTRYKTDLSSQAPHVNLLSRCS